MLDPHYIDCGAAVRRHDTPTIMDGLVVRYELTGRSEISASRNGIALNFIMVHADGRKRFETVLEWAFQQHDHIRACYEQGFYAKVDAIPQDMLGRIEESE